MSDLSGKSQKNPKKVLFSRKMSQLSQRCLKLHFYLLLFIYKLKGENLMEKKKDADNNWQHSFLIICLIGLMAILMLVYKPEGSFSLAKVRQGSIGKTSQKQHDLSDILQYWFEQLENNHKK